MGIIQRIFYFHVPAATAAFCAVFAGGVSSLLYLKTRDVRYDDFALAANESVLVFSVINIVLGSIWGRRAWGIWWTWDARLTSSLLLVLIYLAYVLVRKATPIDQRATIGAVICIFGMADVPLIYMSNRLFRTQHPPPVIGGGREFRA
jgi:heme exporter protein C